MRKVKGGDVKLGIDAVLVRGRRIGRESLARAGRGLSIDTPALRVVGDQARVVAQHPDAPLAVLLDESVLVDALSPLRADARRAVQAELVDARFGRPSVGRDGHVRLKQDVIVDGAVRRWSLPELIERPP